MLKSTALALLLIFSTEHAEGSDFIVHTDGPHKLEQRGSEPCQIELRGEIADGDAETLEAFMVANAEKTMTAEHWGQGGAGYDLCVSGPGGSFHEALKLVQVISNHKIVTAVPRDATCASACAIVFMAGTIFVDGDSPYRILRKGARLGFHAPSIAIGSDQLVPAQVVEASYSAALSDIAGIAGTLLTNSQWGVEPRMHPGLFFKMLATPPQDMFYLSTVNEAGLWGISLEGGERTAVNFSEHNLAQACVNLGSWLEGRDAFPTADRVGGAVPEFRFERVQDNRALRNEVAILVTFTGSIDQFYCTFFVRQNATSIERGTVRVEVATDASTSRLFRGVSLWEFLNPETTIDEAIK